MVWLAWEGTRRHENDPVRKSKLTMGCRPVSPPHKVSSLNQGVEEREPTASTWLAFKYKENNACFCYTRQEAWFSLSGLSELHLSNSASKSQESIFLKRRKEERKERERKERSKKGKKEREKRKEMNLFVFSVLSELRFFFPVYF